MRGDFPAVLDMKMTALVIDACVAIKFVTREQGTDQANAILASDNALIAPDLVQIEIAHGLWNKVASREIDQSEAIGGLAALPELFERLVPASMPLRQAQTLSFTLAHGLRLYLSRAGNRRSGAIGYRRQEILERGQPRRFRRASTIA